MSKRPYRGINLLLLGSLGYERNLYLTFDQVRKLDGTVRRGEHGHIVVFYATKKDKKTEEKNEQDEKPKWILRFYKIFNVSQCELPNNVAMPFVERQNNPISACEKIINECPKPLVIKHEESQAFYNQILNYINMPMKNSFINSESYYDALFHEMTHWTGHPTRLNRPGVAGITRTADSYSFEELIAQLGASFLSNHAGILPLVIDNSAAYISGWLEVLRNDKRLILKASAAAQKATDYILNRRTEPQDSQDVLEQLELIDDKDE
jgi:antirestriction protein ArdC